ncbi:hypothetical protein [Pedobacter borealis]|uniref:hypothetical protein n=1 Tax=Pedobacter borealis TaxID=475254 RepID=UPI0004935A22|nr:hypothetical protein [Pedobacter borealis]
MGAVRMYFKKGMDSWEYGYFTIQLWLKALTKQVSLDDKEIILKTWKEDDIDGLLKQFRNGEVTFSLKQSMRFLLITNEISKRMVSATDDVSNWIFGIVQEKTNRFKDFKEFETYYLYYASACLEKTRDEFDKEPTLRGGLDKWLNK